MLASASTFYQLKITHNAVKDFLRFFFRGRKLWSSIVVKCLQKYYSRWSGSWSTLDWLFKIQNRSSIDKHDTFWVTGHSAPGDCQTCKSCTFWISTQHYCKMKCIILSMCSPNQNDRSNAWIQWLHWAKECCIYLVRPPYHQYGAKYTCDWALQDP